MHLPALPEDLLDLPPTRQAAQAGVGKGAREASLRGLDGVWGHPRAPLGSGLSRIGSVVRSPRHWWGGRKVWYSMILWSCGLTCIVHVCIVVQHVVSRLVPDS